MKKILIIIAVMLCAFSSQADRVEGQGFIQKSLVKWVIGSNTGKTRIRLYTGNTYVDTSTTGQAGSWKRVDNTADSCSASFLITSDSSGMTRPVWEYSVWQLTKTVNAASSHVYRVQTKEKVPNNITKVPYFTPYSIKGMNNGSAGVSIQDSALMLAARVTGSKVSQYSFFEVSGTLARLCPDEVSTTSTAAGDSIIIDSIYVRTR